MDTHLNVFKQEAQDALAKAQQSIDDAKNSLDALFAKVDEDAAKEAEKDQPQEAPKDEKPSEAKEAEKVEVKQEDRSKTASLGHSSNRTSR